MDNEGAVERMVELVGRLRGRSRWAVDAALAAAETEGVSATLILQFASNSNRPPEAVLVSGAWEPQFVDRF